MSDPEHEPHQPDVGGLSSGRLVEVWNPLLEAWTKGFVLVAPSGETGWLERQSDHSLLPTPVELSRMRPEV